MRTARLVGINAYPGCPLQNCVNDAIGLADMLFNSFGFDDVTMLIDDEATQERVIESWSLAVADAKPGDVVLLGHSGHGTEVARSHTSEGLKLSRQQALCFVDIDQKWDDLFTDQALARVLKPLAQGVRLYLVFDACHSAGLRDLQPPGGLPHQARFLAPPIELAPHGGPTNRIGVRQTPDLLEVDPRMRHLLYAACHEHQTAEDGYLGQAHGAFTGALLEDLTACQGVTHVQTMQGIAGRLAAGGFEQRPELIGPADLCNGYFAGGWA